jgi:predicted nucleotidyltransferase
MTKQDDRVADILLALQERAKELSCLYRIEEIINREELSLEEVFGAVIEAIPPGWQYPDVCAARIEYNDTVFAPAGFEPTEWLQKAGIHVFGNAVGTVEVYYTEHMPAADHGPFLREETKLLESIADRLGSCLVHRRLRDAERGLRDAGKEPAPGTRGWVPILHLLRRTDQSMLMRVARKMINHLCWSGIDEARALLEEFRPDEDGDAAPVYFESNRPRKRSRAEPAADLAERTFELAAAHISDDEIIACVHKWIKQDRASFLVNTLERNDTSIAEVSDAIQRYRHVGQGEVELSVATRKSLAVSLVRRFLSDQTEYINIAKDFVEIEDFHQLIQRLIYPPHGHGKVGGKGAGLFLAYQIIRRSAQDELLGGIKTPKTWYLTSDGMHDFIYCNHLEDVFSHKYRPIEEIRQEYPDIVRVFEISQFSAAMVKGLSLALDDLGGRPLVVRSSSLLEDRFGAPFAGKYKSLFLANTGSKQERLDALMDAVSEVYASTFGPDPIEYRAERNLLDFQEGMGVLIQEVVGTQVGDYYLPAFAGVAFSHNEFRWSPRLRQEDGLMRLVPGLGTRAVDRVGDDFPILVAPGQPQLRANASAEEVARYSPRRIDVINLRTNAFETVDAAEFFRRHGDEIPAVEQLVSVLADGNLRPILPGVTDFGSQDVVVTCEGLLSRTPFIKQIHALLGLLESQLRHPVDVEFASDGRDIYLLQCRALIPAKHAKPAPIPRDIARERLVFSADRYVANGTVANITHIVYVDPARYEQLGSREELLAVGRAVGRLNKVLPRRQFILMGPGRWGSRGDIKLGVPVTYSDINNTAMLIEIARKRGDYTPEVSFGTHFFQDLVEAEIRYLPLYPDEQGVVFNEAFLTRSPNLLGELVPELASLADTVRVIDVPATTGGRVLCVLMNAELDEAVAVLDEPVEHAEREDRPGEAVAVASGQDWRWRARIAESIADRLDPARFGVQALYVFGSTKNATAGPASDIDLLVHFTGTGEQRAELERWFEGWSQSLAEINYLRTGYKTDGLLDVHIITDDDVERRSSFAVKIGAVSDAARELPLKRAGG